jgi:hypothetical protein
MAKDSFIFHLENAEDLADLTLEEQGRILQAMISYSQTGEEPDFEDRTLRSVWRPIFRRLKADKEAYEERCELNRMNGQKGGRPKNQPVYEETQKNQTVNLGFPEKPKKPDSDTDSDIDTDYEKKRVPTEPQKKSDQRFSPPTAEQVREYCQEKSLNNVDPQQFVDFYASKGWKVGNQPMKDWKAAARTWNSRQKSPPVNSRNQFLQFEQHVYDMKELALRAKRRV